MQYRDLTYISYTSTVLKEAEESDSDRSSDGNSILELSYSSSSFEGSIFGEDSDTGDKGSAVVEPYLYEPECNNSQSPSPHNCTDHEGVKCTLHVIQRLI